MILNEGSLGFPGGTVVKRPPAKQEMRVRFLGWEDPLEKEMAIQYSILAWQDTVHGVSKIGKLLSMHA